MTNLEIAEKLREQISQQWPYVSTILALWENNKDGVFTERVQSMVSKLLPDEVFYYNAYHHKLARVYNFKLLDDKLGMEIPILSLPINVVLFATKDNPLGILK
jgi:hypothetical protein